MSEDIRATRGADGGLTHVEFVVGGERYSCDVRHGDGGAKEWSVTAGAAPATTLTWQGDEPAADVRRRAIAKLRGEHGRA